MVAAHVYPDCRYGVIFNFPVIGQNAHMSVVCVDYVLVFVDAVAVHAKVGWAGCVGGLCLSCSCHWVCVSMSL